jgi:hypothetical protein
MLTPIRDGACALFVDGRAELRRVGLGCRSGVTAEIAAGWRRHGRIAPPRFANVLRFA